MGVLSCSRVNCDGIMCDLYIPFIGYLCWNCKEEFVDKYKNYPFKNEAEILKKLEAFIERKTIKKTVQKFLKSSFRSAIGIRRRYEWP